LLFQNGLLNSYQVIHSFKNNPLDLSDPLLWKILFISQIGSNVSFVPLWKRSPVLWTSHTLCSCCGFFFSFLTEEFWQWAFSSGKDLKIQRLFHQQTNVHPFTFLSLHIKSSWKSIECSEWKNNNMSSSNMKTKTV
jgi:hypothetical protein